MSVKCPHCHGLIEITKCVEIKSAKSVGDVPNDLGSSVAKSVSEAVDEKVAKFDESMDALTGIRKLNEIARGDLSDSSGTTLAGGWGGAMSHAMRSRGTMRKSSVSAEDFAKQDPSMVDKSQAATLIQNLIGNALGGRK